MVAMNICRAIVVLAGCMILNVMSPVHADDLEMDKLQTEDVTVLYFDPAQTYLSPYVARSFLNSLEFQKKVLGWEPWEPTTVLLKDFGDYGNAAARSSPNNAITIDVAPLSQAFETFSSGERIYTLMNHEPVHVATMDVWNQEDAFWRNFFHGKPMPRNEHPESILYNYLATPRVNVPRWLLEGSAVFMETWMAGGLGRAQGAYDEMVFRSMVRDNAHFYNPLGLEAEGTAVDFQVGVNAYLYGTRFISYLALTRTPEKLVRWLKREEGSARYYSDAFEQTFGQSLDDAWSEWIRWEHDFQKENLKQVRQYPITPVKKLTDQALGSVSRAYFNPKTQSLVGGFRYPGVIGHLGEVSLSTGTTRKLTDIKGQMLYKVTSLAYDPGSNTAWFTTDNYAYRDIVQIDVATGATKTVLKDARIGDIVFNPKDRSLWGFRHLNGYVTLVQIPAPYENWTQVHTWEFGDVPFDLDISADGETMSFSMGHVNGEQTVEVHAVSDLRAGKVQPRTKFSFGSAVPENFVFSPDGKYLYGTAYYTGVSNIFRYEVATGKVDAVSNAETGLFRPVPLEDGSIIAFEYTGQGFAPVKMQPKPLEDLGTVRFLGNEVVTKHPVLKSWGVGSPSRIVLEPLITNRGKYVPSDEMKLAAMYPVVQGYKGYGSFGMHVMIEDPMQFSRLHATASYTPSESLKEAERFHFKVEYETINYHVRYWHNDADFYDLFGPTERSRKGDAVMAGYKWPLVYDPPQQMNLAADVAYFTGLDTLPGNQNVAATSDTIASAALKLDFTDTDKSLGAVDHEKGYRWQVNADVDYSGDKLFPHLYGGFDFGFPISDDHSSVWLYSSAGVSGGPRNQALTPFYFGGFKNNYVDDKEVKRYREISSLPGFEIDEVAARSFIKAIAELNLRPIRFEDVGTPSLYLGSVRPALFGGVLHANPGASDERTVGTIGAQLDFNFTLAHRLPMTLSLGYAAAIEDGEKRNDEWLISLKIM